MADGPRTFADLDVDDGLHRVANALHAIASSLRRGTITPSPLALRQIRLAAQAVLNATDRPPRPAA